VKIGFSAKNSLENKKTTLLEQNVFHNAILSFDDNKVLKNVN